MENKDNIMYLKEYKLNYTLSTIPKNLDVNQNMEKWYVCENPLNESILIPSQYKSLQKNIGQHF